MPRLKNKKQEEFCKELVLKNKFNATKSYQKVYDVDYNSAMSSSSRLLRNDNIQQRCIEILSKTKLNLKDLILSFEQDINATKPITHNNKLVYVRDNTNCLQAKRYILDRVYNLYNKQESNIDNRQINIFGNLSPEQVSDTIAKLHTLKRRRKQEERNGITGEIDD